MCLFLNKEEEGALATGSVLEISKAVIVRSAKEKKVVTSMQLKIYMQLEFVVYYFESWCLIWTTFFQFSSLWVLPEDSVDSLL